VSGTDREVLTCPARFERATYALEAVKMSRNNSLDNSISLARSGVLYAPRSAELGGIAWSWDGICRRSKDRISNLSGKPTKQYQGSP
jgi:hypothetical protein